MFDFSHFFLSPTSLISFVSLFSTARPEHFSFSRLSSLLILCSYMNYLIFSCNFRYLWQWLLNLTPYSSPDLPSELYTHIYLIATWTYIKLNPQTFTNFSSSVSFQRSNKFYKLLWRIILPFIYPKLPHLNFREWFLILLLSILLLIIKYIYFPWTLSSFSLLVQYQIFHCYT